MDPLFWILCLCLLCAYRTRAGDVQALATQDQPVTLFDHDHYDHVQDVPSNATETTENDFSSQWHFTGGCYPALNFKKPDGVPKTPASQWFCPLDSENGFLGFSYYVEVCQSKDQLIADFTRMRNDFSARYVRLYSWCDSNTNFMNDVIDAAWTAGIGVYALIWFGFDGTNEWMGRRDTLVNVVRTNPLAPYVIRSIDVGSEPLYDWVLTPSDLAAEVRHVRDLVQSYGVMVSISEMAYGYSVQGDSQMVLDAEDVVHAHVLPFFDQDATFGSDAWTSVYNATTWFASHTHYTKKIIFTQTGWPSNTNIWGPNSPTADASLDSERQYAKLLDDKCSELKAIAPRGGVGWFWQIWSDAMLDGWGLLDQDGNPKFDFKPRTWC